MKNTTPKSPAMIGLIEIDNKNKEKADKIINRLDKSIKKADKFLEIANNHK